MKTFNDDSEEFFRDNMKGHEFSFDENAWIKMEEMLDTNPSAKPLYKSWKYKMFMVGAIALITMSSYFSHNYLQLLNQPVSISEIIDYTTSQFTDTNQNEITDLSYEYSLSEKPETPFFIDFQTIENLKKIGAQLADLCCIDKITKNEEATVVFAKKTEEGPFHNQIVSKTERYADFLKEEKVYLHFDRTFYQPGENIWFKTYVRDAKTFKESEQSNVVYVQLLSPDKKIEKTLSLVVKDGGAEGDFNLGQDARKGRYLIRAFTNWQRNRNEYIERVIQVDGKSNSLAWSVDFDKSSYRKEENVGAKILLRNANKEYLPNQRFSYYVEINGKKLISQSAKTNKKGKATIEFKLPTAFEKNEGILYLKMEGYRQVNKRIIPGQLKNIDLQFMPEGGELIAGQNITTAFKAVNEFGNSVDVNGVIFNSDNKKVTTFTTYHAGMGGLQFTPKKNEKYYAKITSPVTINKKYLLPEVMEEGYSLKIESQTKKKLAIQVLSPKKNSITLVVRSKDQVLVAEELSGKGGWIDHELNIEDWPVGIAQITVFDQSQTPQSERLIFVNADRNLKLEVATDKQVYQPREKVKLTVSATDGNNKPVAGNFSLAVVEEDLIKFSGDKQGNILSYMLLESDLKGEIEDPNFYFDPSKPKAEKALDYLLLTQGYRRFSWEEIQDSPVADLNYPNEQSVVRGQILDVTNQPLKNAIVKLIANTKEQQRIKTDEDGMFAFVDIDLRNAVRLDIESDECSPNWHPVFMYSNNLKLGLNPYPAMARDLTDYPSGYVPPMYPKKSRIVVENAEILKTVSEKLLLEEPRTELVVVPPKFETTSTKMLVQPATKKSPPVYETVEEQILVKEATTTSKELPAKYETLTKQVVSEKNEDPRTQLTSRGELKTSVNPADWVLVKNRSLRHINYPLINSSYFSGTYQENEKDKNWVITQKKVSTPATNRVETSNPEYKTISRKVEIAPEGVREVQIPAEYKTVYSPVLRIPATSTSKAVFDTLQEEVLLKPAYTTMEKVDAEYKIEEEKILTKKGAKKSVSVAAEYSLATKTVNEKEFNAYARKFKYGFYRARTFYSPKYTNTPNQKEVQDDRKTIFWKSNLNLSKSGTKTVEFYNGNNTTSFISTIEGFSVNGQIGRGTHRFESKMPIQIEAKLPEALLKGDKFTIPVQVTNNLEETLTGKLNIVNPVGYKLLSEQLERYSIDGQKTATIVLEYEVVNETAGSFSVEFVSRGLADKLTVQTIANSPNQKTVNRFSGTETNNSYSFSLTSDQKESIISTLKVYPSAKVSLIEKAKDWSSRKQQNLEGFLSSIEPDLLLLEQIEKGTSIEHSIEEQIKARLTDKLVTIRQFEMEQGGFFQNNPNVADEVQTAMAISYLTRVSKFVAVDENLIDHNLRWLLNRRSNKGGWKLNDHLVYEGVNKSILEAAIVWALSEAGYKNEITKEMNQVFEDLGGTTDGYHQILVATALINAQDVRGTELLDNLLSMQQSNGSWIGNSQTFTNKNGRIQTLATTALMISAISKTYIGVERQLPAKKYLLESINFIEDKPVSESALILRALAQNENGSVLSEEELSVLVNGKVVATKRITLDQISSVEIKGLEKHLVVGENLVEIRFGFERLNHEFRNTYTISENNKNSHLIPLSIDLKTAFSETETEKGKVVPLKISLNNLKDKTIPFPTVSLQVPGGLALEHWQLEKMKQEKQILDFSIAQGHLLLTLNHLQPKQKTELEIGFRAKISGTFYLSNVSFSSNGIEEFAMPMSLVQSQISISR